METEKAIPTGYMTVGEVAQKMGVTVRTLHSFKLIISVFQRLDSAYFTYIL